MPYPSDPPLRSVVGFRSDTGTAPPEIRGDESAVVLEVAGNETHVAVDRSQTVLRVSDGSTPDGSQLVLRVVDDPTAVVNIDRSQIVVRVSGGPVGPRGPQGPAGAEGRSVNVYGPQVSTPRPERKGDVWLVASSGQTRALHPVVSLDHDAVVNAGVRTLPGA